MAKQRRTPDDFARDMKERALTRSQENTRDTYIKRGQEAWRRHKSDATWTDWLAIGEALAIGRQDAMGAAATNQPIGAAYNIAFGKWIARYGFDEIDKGDRHRLLEVMEHRAEIEAWRSTLTSTERLRVNHPSTVLRKWKAATQPKAKTGKQPKPNVRREDNVELERAPREAKEEVNRLEGELKKAETELRNAKAKIKRLKKSSTNKGASH